MFLPLKVGAGNVTRTHDLLITNQLLYRLSYTSMWIYQEPHELWIISVYIIGNSLIFDQLTA